MHKRTCSREEVTKKNLKLRTKHWINSDIQKLMSYL